MIERLEGRNYCTNNEKGRGGVEDYRGVTMMSTLYKASAMVLAERLREELDRKGVIPQNQTGFRKEVGTIDNIYVTI